MVSKNIGKQLFGFAALTIIVIIIMGNTMIGMSSARAELISPEKLPFQVNEGKTVSFIIRIDDYSDAKIITIDTSLIGIDNNPIYDFGDLNPSITASRYNSMIILDVSSLPLKEFKVTISGRAPMGETRVPIQDTNIIVSKLDKATKKYYEVIVDKKSMNIEPFELIIKSNEEFTETIDKLQWKEFDGIKKESVKMFSNGLTSEAQNIVNELVKINIPNNLLLFGIITIDNNLLLNIIVVSSVICSILIGFYVGFMWAANTKPEDD